MMNLNHDGDTILLPPFTYMYFYYHIMQIPQVHYRKSPYLILSSAYSYHFDEFLGLLNFSLSLHIKSEGKIHAKFSSWLGPRTNSFSTP